MKKQLFYLSASTIPSASANSVHVMKMCDAFQKKGIETTLFCRRGSDKSKVDAHFFYGTEPRFRIKNYPTVNLPGVSFLTSLFYLLDILRSQKSNTIYYGRDIPSLLLCTKLGFDVVYESHGIPQKKALAWMERSLLNSRRLKGVVFISDALRDLYNLSQYNFKAIVLHDSADRPPNHTDKIELKGDSSFNAVYVGALYAGRGVDLISDLADALPTVGFHLFGGNELDVARLNQESIHFGRNNIHFYAYVPPSETYKCRNSADVLLMPYQKSVMTINNASETSRYMSPLKLFEYMSSHKPIISSDHVVLQEVLTNEVNALLCDPENVGQWKESIQRLTVDQTLCRKLAENAYEHFETAYTWDIRAALILSSFGNEQGES